MFKNLENYLEEIDHHLVVAEGGEEILAEIRDHILEKAAKEFGEVNEETIAKVTAAYGSPEDVAAKYIKDYQIISPLYKKYLVRYTLVLFAFHGSLTVLAFLLNIKIQAFPIFFVPEMKNFYDLISQLPMTLLYDLGLVGIFFYFVTQYKGSVALKWPEMFKVKEKKVEADKKVQDKKTTEEVKPAKVKDKELKLKEPKLIYLALLVAGFCCVLFIYIKYGTLFFRSLNPEDIKPLFKPIESTIYSLFLVNVFALEIIFYIIRFFKNSAWVNLIKNGVYLLVLLAIINFPVKDAFTSSFSISISDPYFIGYSLVRLLVFILAVDSITLLVNILRNRWRKGA